MGLVMKADEDLTIDVIAEFVDLYVNDFGLSEERVAVDVN